MYDVTLSLIVCGGSTRKTNTFLHFSYRTFFGPAPPPAPRARQPPIECTEKRLAFRLVALSCRRVVLLACCVVGLFGCEPCAISRRCACMTSPCTLTSGLSWVCSLRSFSCDALISFEGQHSNRAIRLANKTWTRATRVASLWHRGCRQPGWWALPSSGIASVQLCRVRRPIASVLSCGGWLQSISHRSSSGLLTDVSGIGYRDMCKCIITFCAISC